MNQFLLKRLALLFLLCGSFFFFGNNLVQLTDPDEVFYSLTAREMGQHQQWMTPYIFNQPQFEKPIFTYWMIKLSFLIFGENPFAARFFPAVFATFGVFAAYALGLLGFMNERRAFLAACVLGTSAFYLAMGKTVFTDMIFSVLILLSLLSFYLAYRHTSYQRVGILTFYFFASLAVLTKGPLGFFIPAATVVVFLLYTRQLSFLRLRWFPIGLCLCLLAAVPWYWSMTTQYGAAFIQEFFYNDHWRRLLEAEHKGNDNWYFYPVTMVWGVFPWSIFLVAAFVNLFRKLKVSIKPFEYFLLSWILVVFLVFQVAHSKLTSYILPMFPALALLTANYIEEKFENYQNEVLKKLCYPVIGLLALLGIASVAVFDIYKIYIPNKMPAYLLSAGLISLSGISLTLLIQDKIRTAIALLSCSLVPVFLTAFMISSYVEPYVSMYDACLYVPSNINSTNKMLTSKSNARGVRYYSRQNVAVLDMGGSNYFSPHPVAILNSKEKLLTFLNSQKQTFAIVKKSAYEDLRDNYDGHFHVDILKISGRHYVLKIESVKT